MKIRIRSVFGLAAAVVAATLAATPGHAQVVEKKLVRAFNNCDFPASYVFDDSFFTADGPETTVTYSRTHVACSERCQPVGIGGDNVCNHFCFWNDRACVNGGTCGACIGVGCSGPCVSGVDLTVGYVLVLKATRFCAIAACSGTIPLGCPPSSTCDGSGTCADSVSNAKNLCLCPDPACPIGQRICNGTRPTLPAADVIYEPASTGTNPEWITGYATMSSGAFSMNGTALPTSLAQVRFPTVPGQEYVLVTKWSTYPIVSAFSSCADAALLLSIDARPDSCGP